MIDDYSAGQMTIGKQKHDKDLKIINGRVVDHWRRTKGHRLETADVMDILEAGPEIIVVGMGYAGNMRVEPDLRSRLNQQNIELIAENTQTATETFNRLYAQGKKVAGAFHLTC